mmetsp:Transcript_18869/g.54635  ORF Transcript_18869/g.54635 Transcript_18869/m.54635 type:complete len:306 (-) Transcript_18869:1657-2574(-)
MTWPRTLQKSSTQSKRRHERAMLLMEATSKRMVAKKDVADLKISIEDNLMRSMEDNKRARREASKKIGAMHKDHMANRNLLYGLYDNVKELRDNVKGLRESNKAMQKNFDDLKSREQGAQAKLDEQLKTQKSMVVTEVESAVKSILSVHVEDKHVQVTEGRDGDEEIMPPTGSSSLWSRAFSMSDCACAGYSSVDGVNDYEENTFVESRSRATQSTMSTTKSEEDDFSLSTYNARGQKGRNDERTIGFQTTLGNTTLDESFTDWTVAQSTVGQTTTTSGTFKSSETKTCYDLPRQSTNLGRRLLQ